MRKMLLVATVLAVALSGAAHAEEGPCPGPNQTQPTRTLIHAAHEWGEEEGLEAAHLLHEFECAGSADPDLTTGGVPLAGAQQAQQAQAAEEKAYIATLDPIGAGVCADHQGEYRTPVAPPMGIGAVCFSVTGRTSVRVAVLDALAPAVSYNFAFYTAGGTCIPDGTGLCLRHECAAKTFAVPAGAAILEVHPSGSAGALTCYFRGGTIGGVATTGLVRIT